MKKLIFCLFTCFLVSGIGKSYEVGVEYVNNYPYYGYDKNEKYLGIGKTILDQFAKEKGLTFKYTMFPVERLFRVFLKGDVDFKYPDNPLWRQELKKDKKIYYSEPLANYIDGVMVLPKNKGKGIPQLKKLSTIRGFTAYSYLDLIKAKKVQLKPESHVRSALRAVMRGITDGAYVNIEVAKHIMKKEFKDQTHLVFDPELPHDKGGYMVSSSKHKLMIEELNKFVKGSNVRNKVLNSFHVDSQF